MVDLTPFMREDILLNLPAHPHCDRDGGRICKAAQPGNDRANRKRKPDWSASGQAEVKADVDVFVSKLGSLALLPFAHFLLW